MRGFIIKIFIFLAVGVIIGEIIARLYVLSSDIPRREIGLNGIQKYIPDQTGSWKGDSHKWQINAMGWPGPLPKSKENLITIIGDSYIENFMNPDECRQAVYLKNLMPTYNFMEASRSGVSFIEAIKISKQLDSLKPKYQLFHVHDSDFEESIVQLKKLSDITQLDIDKNVIIDGKLKSPGLKLILYNWKFLYYMYNQYKSKINGSPQGHTNKIENQEISDTDLQMYKNLLVYVKKNYDIGNKILIFRPDSSKDLVRLATSLGFNTYSLNDEDDTSWSFDYDSHWTCYGHKKAAEQVAKKLSRERI